MKQFIMIMALSLCMAQAAQSQSEEKAKEVQFYLTGGMKAFSPKAFGQTNSVAPSMVPMLGGGALWQLGRIQLGAEFNYLDGKKDTEDFESILTGINGNIIVGYAWELSRSLKLSAQSGFTYSLHHLAVTDNAYAGPDNLNATIYHNLSYSVPVSVMLQRVGSGGLTTGLRLGYQIGVGPNEWRYIEGANTEVFTSGADGFYFQLVFGGLLGRKGQGQ